MSESKRRKINRKQDSKSSLQEFRESILDLIPCMFKEGREVICFSTWDHCFTLYMRRFPRSVRTKGSAWEVTQERFRKNPDKKKLKQWGKGVSSGSTPDSKSYKEIVENMSISERIEEILSYGPPLEHQKFFLSELIKFVKHQPLMRFWKTLKTSHKGISKQHCVEELTNMFFGEDSNIQKRATEEENVSSLSKDDGFRFISLCEIQIPQEVLLHIFSFLKYDKSLIYDIGRICKTFYISILSSWKTLNVKKENIYKISVLVLQSCKTICFSEREGSTKRSPSKDGVFRIDEMMHILNQLNSERIREIIFETTVTTTLKILRYLYRKRNKLPSGLSSVRILRLKTLNCTKKSTYDAALKNSKMTLIDVFPGLEEVENPLKFRYFEGLRLRKIFFNFSFIEKLCQHLRKDRKFQKNKNVSGFFGDNNKNNKIELSTEGVKSLRIDCNIDKDYSLISNLILSFPNVEEIKFNAGPHEIGIQIDRLFPRTPQYIETLHLGVGNLHQYSYPSATDIKSGHTIFNKLKKLVIHPSTEIDSHERKCSLDNLDQFLSLFELKNLTHLRCSLLISHDKTKKWRWSGSSRELLESLDKNLLRFEDARIGIIWVQNVDKGIWGSGNVWIDFQTIMKKRGTYRTCRAYRNCSLTVSGRLFWGKRGMDDLPCYYKMLSSLFPSVLMRNNLVDGDIVYEDRILEMVVEGKVDDEQNADVMAIEDNVVMEETDAKKLEGQTIEKLEQGGVPKKLVIFDTSKVFLGEVFKKGGYVKILELEVTDDLINSQKYRVCKKK